MTSSVRSRVSAGTSSWDTCSSRRSGSPRAQNCCTSGGTGHPMRCLRVAVHATSLMALQASCGDGRAAPVVPCARPQVRAQAQSIPAQNGQACNRTLAGHGNVLPSTPCASPHAGDVLGEPGGRPHAKRLVLGNSRLQQLQGCGRHHKSAQRAASEQADRPKEQPAAGGLLAVALPAMLQSVLTKQLLSRAGGGRLDNTPTSQRAMPKQQHPRTPPESLPASRHASLLLVMPCMASHRSSAGLDKSASTASRRRITCATLHLRREGCRQR